MGEDYATFDQKKADLHYEIKKQDITDSLPYKKATEEYEKNLKNNKGSATCFKLQVDLVFTRIRMLSDLYYETTISALDEKKPISDNMKADLNIRISKYFSKEFDWPREFFKGILKLHGFSNSPVATLTLSLVDIKSQALLKLYENKLEMECESRKQDALKIDQQKTETASQSKVESQKVSESSKRIELISGYRRMKWFDNETNLWETFNFNDTQAKIVEALHKAYPEPLHVKVIIQNIGKVLSRYEMHPQFRYCENKNWKKMIVHVRKGFWRLNI